jgi:hypothetical protein
MQASLAEIDKLHGLLKSALRPSVYGETTIDQVPQFRETNAWREKRYSGKVAFWLWSSPMAGQILDNKRKSPVHQLRDVGDSDNSGWMSWQEAWDRVRGENTFKMISVGVAFYWGSRTHLDQIFRAEWCGNGIEKAAHPHWHADCAVIGADLGISRFHFGMGGWDHAGEHSACWQIHPGKVNEIVNWALKTIQYCREQLCHYPPN